MPTLHNRADQRLLERCTTPEERTAFLELYQRDPLRWQPPTPLTLPPHISKTTAALIRLLCYYHPEPTSHNNIKDQCLTIALSRFLISSYVTQLANEQTIPHYQLTASGIIWITTLCQEKN